MIERLTYKQARQLLAKAPKKPSKYKNVRFWQDGIFWHSRREYERWLLLVYMQQAGEIARLERQVCFDLHVNGTKVGRYYADFTYYDSAGKFHVEDVKAKPRAGQKHSATATAVYQRSKRHLKAEYGLDICEV
jgi:Protein of unknown function (DUF1064)